MPTRAQAIDIGISAGDQLTPKTLAIGPNKKMPAVVGPEGSDGTPASRFGSVANPLQS